MGELLAGISCFRRKNQAPWRFQARWLPVRVKKTRQKRRCPARIGGSPAQHAADDPRGIIHRRNDPGIVKPRRPDHARSEEHTSELQSRFDLVCRLLLEKKNNHVYGESPVKKKKKINDKQKEDQQP